MAGSTESGLAGALEAQAKTLATQAKLLQQICDRLDAQDRHWESLERSVATNARSIASLSTTIGGLEAATVQSDAAKALSMQIESRLSDMTSSTWQRIDAVDATLSARVVALESATATLEAWRPGVERSVGAVHTSMEGLCLDVARLADRLDQGPRASTPLRPSVLGPYTTTGGAHLLLRSTSKAREGTAPNLIVGRVAMGMPIPKVHSRTMVCLMVLLLLLFPWCSPFHQMVLGIAHVTNSFMVWATFPRSHFRGLTVTTRSCGSEGVTITLPCTRSTLMFGSKSLRCISRGLRHAGFSQ
jgi:hypothetical protein